MDQLKSNSVSEQATYQPKRKFTLEIVVGLFSLVALVAAGYLCVNLGGLDLNSANNYYLKAEFNDVSGLKNGASVEISGVKIGEVTQIDLAESKAQAIITLKLINEVQIQDDDIAMIRTKGIIGDRYVKFSRGASESYLKPGATIYETESVVDLEDIIGKFVHNFGGEDKPAEETPKAESLLQ